MDDTPGLVLEVRDRWGDTDQPRVDIAEPARQQREPRPAAQYVDEHEAVGATVRGIAAPARGQPACAREVPVLGIESDPRAVLPARLGEAARVSLDVAARSVRGERHAPELADQHVEV